MHIAGAGLPSLYGSLDEQGHRKPCQADVDMGAGAEGRDVVMS